ALRADVPARVGNVVDLSELVFRGRLAAHDVVRVEGEIGQPTDRAGVAADQDRVVPAHRHMAATDHGLTGGVGHGHRACTHCRAVASAVGGRGATGRHRGHVAVFVLNGHARVVHHRVAGGQATALTQVDVLGQVEGDVVAVVRLGDDAVAVGLLQVNRVAGLTVHAHVGGVLTLRADIPARIGHLVDAAKLVFGRRLAVGDVVRIKRAVGQPTDGAGVTADHDRVLTAHRHLVATDHGLARGIGHGDRA